MASLLASIPLQLVCQLVVTGSPETTSNFTDSPPTVKPTPPQFESTSFPDGYIVYPSIGFAYKVHNDSVRWNVARKRCDAEGGNLAVIDSWEKFDYLSRQRQSKGLTHVGIHDLYDEDEWVSVKNGPSMTLDSERVFYFEFCETLTELDDFSFCTTVAGSTLNSIPWATGEPTLNGGAHCVMVKSQNGGLGNFGCANFQGDFVCEMQIQNGYVTGGDHALTRVVPN